MTPWDAAQKRLFAAHQFDAQTKYYQEKHPDAAHDIILCDDEPASRLYVNRGEEHIAILDITVLVEYRMKGIGTALIGALKDEAARTNRSLRIYVEPFNSAQKLFGELGFEAVPDDGVNLRFEWRT